MTDPDTEARLAVMHRDREAGFAELFADYDRAWDAPGGPIQADVDAEEALDTAILGVAQTRGFEVTISTGGPGEWLECTVDEEGLLTTVEFCCAWWSPVRRTTVNEGDALWRLAERFSPWE